MSVGVKWANLEERGSTVVPNTLYWTYIHTTIHGKK